jgi:hypothetical protein
VDEDSHCDGTVEARGVAVAREPPHLLRCVTSDMVRNRGKGPFLPRESSGPDPPIAY